MIWLIIGTWTSRASAFETTSPSKVARARHGFDPSPTRRLDEYLTHLDRTGFSFDGGPSLDFAEAALLIQSSACVYSKKVEYLHNLVYQVGMLEGRPPHA